MPLAASQGLVAAVKIVRDRPALLSRSRLGAIGVLATLFVAQAALGQAASMPVCSEAAEHEDRCESATGREAVQRVHESAPKPHHVAPPSIVSTEIAAAAPRSRPPALQRRDAAYHFFDHRNGLGVPLLI